MLVDLEFSNGQVENRHSAFELALKLAANGRSAQTNAKGQPIWKLVLMAAERLQAGADEFSLNDLIREVQRMEPSRQRNSIQPVIQGMTSNAGMGPYSPCGEPLFRVSRGIYRLAGDKKKAESRFTKERITTSPPINPSAKRPEVTDVKTRVVDLIADFSKCLDAYDQRTPFTRSGQYSLHRATIDQRRSFSSVSDAIEDESFLESFHQTLYAWGIGKRASKLVNIDEFQDRLLDCSEEISRFEHMRLDDHALDLTLTSIDLWSLIERLKVVQNVSLIVPATKTLHHLLPDLVPPMDRAWTGAFFQWSFNARSAERMTFIRTFSSFAKIARETEPANYVGTGWRTSLTKVLDNAVIGYCKLHEIEPRGS